MMIMKKIDLSSMYRQILLRFNDSSNSANNNNNSTDNNNTGTTIFMVTTTTAVAITTVIVVIASILFFYYYRVWSTLYQKQFQFLQKSTFVTRYWNDILLRTTTRNTQQLRQDPFRMIRCHVTNGTKSPSSTSNTSSDPLTKSSSSSSSSSEIKKKRIQMLSLNPAFVQYCCSGSSSNSRQPPQQQQHLEQQSEHSKVLPSPSSPSSSHPEWKLMSFGDYISSLRPYISTTTSGKSNDTATSSSSSSSSIIPDWLECEIQSALAVALLTSCGPRWGTVILPTLGLNMVHTTVQTIVSKLSSYFSGTSKTTGRSNNSVDDDDIRAMDTNAFYDDHGTIPISLSTMSTGAEINYQQYKQQQHRKQQQPPQNSPLDLLQIGEAGYQLTFSNCNENTSSNNHHGTDDDADTVGTVETTTAINTTKNDSDNYDDDDDDLPNPFILSEHWSTTIELMEQRMMRLNHQDKDGVGASSLSLSQYDPESYQMTPGRTVIDERLFPDLYMGWGEDVLCTHNQRQILDNRLLSTILNRLAYNIHIDVVTTNKQKNTTNCDDTVSNNDTIRPTYFIVQLSRGGAEMKRPRDLIQALIDNGHHVTTSIQTQPTTFGMALCVKEADDTWTNIPFGYFVQTGLSDSDGKEAHVCLPHSGLNLDISHGPFLPNNSVNDSCISIQHFMAIEGLCGWHSNHCANVPWIQNITCHDTTRHNYEALDSIRTASLQATIMTTAGTQYDLPHGGYGLTAVCNDSAAQIEYAIRRLQPGTDAGMATAKTHIYPITSHGKFAMHTLRVAHEIRKTLARASRNNNTNTTHENSESAIKSNDDDIECIDRLIKAIISLPSDTNTTPIADVIDQCDRYLQCWHGQSLSNNNSNATTTSSSSISNISPVFQLLIESRTIVESIQNELIEIQNSNSVNR